MEETVFSGLTAAWRRARVPTRRSPPFANATTDGVVRPPSELGMTTASPPSITATTELEVPRAIPTALAMLAIYCLDVLFSQFRHSHLVASMIRLYPRRAVINAFA